jgi:hypothetical protein
METSNLKAMYRIVIEFGINEELFMVYKCVCIRDNKLPD